MTGNGHKLLAPGVNNNCQWKKALRDANTVRWL